MRYALLLLCLALAACSSKKEPQVVKPVMNQTAPENELGCHNQPAMIKDCTERLMCRRFGEDEMNYDFCLRKCERAVKKSCRKARPPGV